MGRGSLFFAACGAQLCYELREGGLEGQWDLPMSKVYEALQKGRSADVFELSAEPPAIAADELPERISAGQAPGGSRSAPAGGPGEFDEPRFPDLAAEPEILGEVRRLRIDFADKSPLLPFNSANFVAAEQYRVIRTRLIQHLKQPRLVLISSGGPGDGKSITAINIAGALSLKTDAKVLLVDADFRRPTIHTQLGFPATPGLSDVLSGSAALEEALIRTEQFPNLYVLPAGAPRSNPSELLDSERWRTLCGRLRSTFRYVIADSPPVATVADYELLQASLDGVILVVRPEHTKRQACLGALKIIPKEKLVGVVINCVEDWFLARRQSYAAPYYYSSATPGNGK